MADSLQRLQYLLEQARSKQATATELEELLQIIGNEPSPEVYQLLNAFHANVATGGGQPYDRAFWEQAARDILEQDRVTADIPVRRIGFLRWGWVAASLLFILAAGVYLREHYGHRQAPPMVTAANTEISPGKAGAILTLADGSQMVLDSLGNGVVATQQGTKVLLKDGELAYEGKGVAVYNTITIPKGRQFQLQLPDGTRVWLNAASSLRYPTAFTGGKRVVEIKGEAYFEVARNAAQPFHVNVNGKAGIEVLGTNFNVNAYENEHTISTTLLEGSLRVSGNTAGEAVILKPGQQAKIAQGILVEDNADIDKVMAWRNGLFNFEGANLEAVMKQLERWYDIEVVYEGKPPVIRFVGKMDKNIPLKDLLEILETSNVHFRLEEGRKLVVKQ